MTCKQIKCFLIIIYFISHKILNKDNIHPLFIIIITFTEITEFYAYYNLVLPTIHFNCLNKFSNKLTVKNECISC